MKAKIFSFFKEMLKQAKEEFNQKPKKEMKLTDFLFLPKGR